MKRMLCLVLVLLLLAACVKTPAPPVQGPQQDRIATPATPPEPLPPVATPPQASQLPPPPPKPEPEPMPEPMPDTVYDAASAGLAASVPAAPEETDTGIPISENLVRELETAKIELELLRLINALRTESGVEPLGLQEQMLYAARVRSVEALEKFSHTRPDSTPYNTAFDEAGFSYAGKWHGENLASLSFSAGQLNEEEAALKIFEGLNASAGHRENMARGNFAQVGVGVASSVENEKVTLASAQLFASF